MRKLARKHFHWSSPLWWFWWVMPCNGAYDVIDSAGVRFVGGELCRDVARLQGVDEDGAGRCSNGDDVTAMDRDVMVGISIAVDAIRHGWLSLARPKRDITDFNSHILFSVKFEAKNKMNHGSDEERYFLLPFKLCLLTLLSFSCSIKVLIFQSWLASDSIIGLLAEIRDNK